MNEVLQKLIEAEEKANLLFKNIEERKLVEAGKSERQLNEEVYELAYELLGIKKYWHKRIVRAGRNTLFPYRENPPDLVLQDNEIVFFDFGPVFEEWEADIGRTYVLGDDPEKIKLKNDIELAWNEGCEYFKRNKEQLTGAGFYSYSNILATKFGWEFGNIHCGHLIGNFPHEVIVGEETINYIHPENDQLMSNNDRNGNERFWIYEIHFVDKLSGIGGFYEKLLY